MVTSQLTARSVLLSVLLGSDPPRLPASLLVRTTALFGISEGTTRTALSRMAAQGELRAHPATGARSAAYELRAPGLLARRARQEQSRRGDSRGWDGTWRWAIVVAGGPRRPNDRARLRADLTRARLAELRDGVWLRPDNLDLTADATGAADVLWCSGLPEVEPTTLAAGLWDLTGWAAEARRLTGRLGELTGPLLDGVRDVLADGFVLNADALRHFQADPLLPDDLLPADWPGSALRETFDTYDAAYRRVLSGWFREQLAAERR